MVWSCMTSLEYKLDDHFLVGGQEQNCLDTPTYGLQQDLNKVCMSRARSRLQILE